MRRLAFVYIFVLIFSFCGKNVSAQGTAGLYNPIFGASALAQENAFVARADDPSAIYFNPAGLMQLVKPQLSLGASFVLPFVEYHGNGVSEDIDTKINTIPNMYFTSPIIENKLAAGIGVNVPYGLQSKWDGDGFSRYVVTDFNLRIININPTITYKPFFSPSVRNFICDFENKQDAELFCQVLSERLGKFGLEISPEKMRILPFIKFRQCLSKRFDIFGFEFRWDIS